MTTRVALVTGGTGGIGTAIVKRLADMGHKVATNYRDEAKTRATFPVVEGRRWAVAVASPRVLTVTGPSKVTFGATGTGESHRARSSSRSGSEA